jgi:hypothetical protein
MPLWAARGWTDELRKPRRVLVPGRTRLVDEIRAAGGCNTG